MRKATLTLCLLIIYSTITLGQTTFSKRIFEPTRPFVIFTGVEVVNDHYYVNGVSKITYPPFNNCNVVGKYDLEGNVIEINSIESPLQTLETWGAGLFQNSDSTLQTFGYAVKDGTEAVSLEYDLDASSTTKKQYANSFFPGKSIQPTSSLRLSDGYIFCALSADKDEAPTSFAHIYRLNEEKNIVWEKAFDLDNDLAEGAFSILESANSNYTVGAWRNNANIADMDFTYQTYLFGLDDDGEKIWEWLSPEEELQNGARTMIATPDGGLIIGTGIGEEVIFNPGIAEIHWTNYIYKLDAEQNLLWSQPFRYGIGGPAPRGNLINKMLACPDDSGYIAVGSQYIQYLEEGSILDENTYDQAGIIIKISTEGDSLWSRTIIHPDLPTFADEHEIIDFEFTPDGGMICVGRSDDLLQTDNTRQQAWLLKVDEYGCLVPGCNLPNSTEEPMGEAPVQMLIYPNPAQELLNVFVSPQDFSQDLSLQISNAQGQILRKIKIPAIEATSIIDITDLESGYYQCTVTSNQGIILSTKTFVKS